MTYQAALGFVTSQTEAIETQVYARQYAAITYTQDIPLAPGVPEWTAGVSFYSSDSVGQAELIGGKVDDIPLANVTRAKHTVSIQMAAIGYQFSLEEIGQAQMLGMDLSAEGAMAARKAYEQFMDAVAYSGQKGVGNGQGLYNLSGITSATASAPWDGATASAILDDLNGLLSGLMVDSKGLEMANVVKVPLALFSTLTSNRLSEHSDTTILDHIKASNVLTAMTGQALDIKADHRLADKVLVYRKDPDVLRLHVPMPLKFLPPQSVNLHITVPGMFRTSGLEVRNPHAIRELTGVA